ncbi:MAG: SIS domain-containing protein, partial [Actinobacteria bacterium]|nr:SIS domain-containing protein [Actinomycetota bacterium]
MVRAVDAVDRRQIEAVARVLMSTWSSDATVYTMGNGGSASLASHMACDLGKNTAPDLGGGPG